MQRERSRLRNAWRLPGYFGEPSYRRSGTWRTGFCRRLGRSKRVRIITNRRVTKHRTALNLACLLSVKNLGFDIWIDWLSRTSGKPSCCRVFSWRSRTRRWDKRVRQKRCLVINPFFIEFLYFDSDGCSARGPGSGTPGGSQGILGNLPVVGAALGGQGSVGGLGGSNG